MEISRLAVSLASEDPLAATTVGDGSPCLSYIARSVFQAPFDLSLPLFCFVELLGHIPDVQ